MLMTTEKGNLAEVRDAVAMPRIDLKPIGATVQRDWYMIVARPGHELEAVDGFRRHGVRAYWPNYEKFVGTRGKAGPRLKVLVCGIIAGYFFTPGSQSEDLEDVIERTTGAVSFVRTFSGNPLFLSEDDIKIIRAIEKVENTPKPKATAHKFIMDQKVRFVDDVGGRWPDGRIIKLARGGRISVSVALMGREVAISVFPHQIERI
jgi:transcription antitermination factor NusG